MRYNLVWILSLVLLSSCAGPTIIKNEHWRAPPTNRALGLFLDGTANSATTRTHVRSLFELTSVQNNPAISTFYNEGVGGAIYERTGLITPLASGAARGISKDIRQAYLYLAENYQKPFFVIRNSREGQSKKVRDDFNYLAENCAIDAAKNYTDSVYLFGFSRGSYTARSLIGMANWYGGVPDASECSNLKSKLSKKAVILAIYNTYRSYGLANCNFISKKEFETNHACQTLNKRRKLLIQKYPPRKVNFAFVGLWDTVRTIGTEALKCLGKGDGQEVVEKEHVFHIANDFNNVNYLYHALSLNEERDCYNLDRLKIKEELPYMNEVKEVWFSGDHSNLGSNWRNENELPGVSMRWMLSKLFNAQNALKVAVGSQKLLRTFELQFIYADPCGWIGDLYNGFMGKVTGRNIRKVRDGDNIHISVVARYGNENAGKQRRGATHADQEYIFDADKILLNNHNLNLDRSGYLQSENCKAEGLPKEL